MRSKPGWRRWKPDRPRAEPADARVRLRATAILLAARPQGETGAVARLLTAEHGLVAGYVAGGRGRQLRAVMVPGNRVALELVDRTGRGLPFAKLELEASRAALMTEPLAAAAIDWACALTAAALPEQHPYPALHAALEALLEAVALASSARGWLGGLNAYEALLLRDLGYGGAGRTSSGTDLAALLEALAAREAPLAQLLLAATKRDVMGARRRLTERLARMA